jgi:hypothetical protein
MKNRRFRLLYKTHPPLHIHFAVMRSSLCIYLQSPLSIHPSIQSEQKSSPSTVIAQPSITRKTLVQERVVEYSGGIRYSVSGNSIHAYTQPARRHKGSVCVYVCIRVEGHEASTEYFWCRCVVENQNMLVCFMDAR